MTQAVQDGVSADIEFKPETAAVCQAVCKLTHCDHEAAHEFRWGLAMVWSWIRLAEIFAA